MTRPTQERSSGGMARYQGSRSSMRAIEAVARAPVARSSCRPTRSLDPVADVAATTEVATWSPHSRGHLAPARPVELTAGTSPGLAALHQVSMPGGAPLRVVYVIKPGARAQVSLPASSADRLRDRDRGSEDSLRLTRRPPGPASPTRSSGTP